MIDLLLGILATWRLTSLLHAEDGPFDLFARLRDWAGVRYDERSQAVADSEVGKALTCFLCTSVWSALVVTVCQRKGSLVNVLAYSAGAILIETMRGGREG